VRGEPRIGVILASNGGSFQEAVAIADRFEMTTVVDAGKTCLSACGVVFMAARRGDEKPDRHMHATARVGFHAPFLPNIGGRFTRETLANAYLVGMTASVGLLERQKKLSLTDGWVHDMLANGPDRFAEVRYIHHAIEYGIAIYGMRTPRTSPQEMVTHLCENQIREEQQVGHYDDMFKPDGSVIASKIYGPHGGYYGIERRANTYTLNGTIDSMAGQICNARLVISGKRVRETWRKRNVHFRGRAGGRYLLHSRWTQLNSAHRSGNTSAPRKTAGCGWYAISKCAKSAGRLTRSASRYGGDIISTSDPQFPNFRNGWYCVVEGLLSKSRARREARKARRKGARTAYIKRSC